MGPRMDLYLQTNKPLKHVQAYKKVACCMVVMVSHA